MQQIALALPILPGKRQQARQFMEQLEGPRRAEYELADREIGVVQETWFLQPAVGDGARDNLIMYLTSEDLADTFGKFIAAEDGVLAYFKEQLLEVTGQDWNVPPDGPLPELLSHLDLDGR